MKEASLSLSRRLANVASESRIPADAGTALSPAPLAPRPSGHTIPSLGRLFTRPAGRAGFQALQGASQRAMVDRYCADTGSRPVPPSPSPLPQTISFFLSTSFFFPSSFLPPPPPWLPLKDPSREDGPRGEASSKLPGKPFSLSPSARLQSHGPQHQHHQGPASLPATRSMANQRRNVYFLDPVSSA